MLDGGANPELRGKSGQSLFYTAAKDNQPALVKSLIAAKADCNAKKNLITYDSPLLFSL